MRAEGYRVQVVIGVVLLASLVGCGGPAVPSRSAAATAQGASSPVLASGSASGGTSRTAAATGSAVARAPSIRIAVSGRGPIGMAVDGDTGWVAAADSGDLLELDLAAGQEAAAIAIGVGASSVVVGDDGSVFVSRIGMDESGENLVKVDAAGRKVSRIRLEPLGGLAAGESGTLWALEKTGRILHVDPATGSVLAHVDVPINPNEHTEIVSGSGARWMASDTTAVRRIAADATIAADIATGGGIPLAFDGGRVWGARADELWAIDPATNAIAARVPLLDIAEILSLDVAGSDVWIAARRAGRIGVVVRLELPTGRVIGEYPVSLPAAVVLTADRAWVTNNDRNEVLAFER
jgi:DNA-binding beta-propeller fold protein YncE